MPIGERGESSPAVSDKAVAIARAVLNDPRCCSSTNPPAAWTTRARKASSSGCAVFAAGKTILVTHRTSLLDLVDRLIVLDQGQIVADGPKAQVVEAFQQGRIGRAG